MPDTALVVRLSDRRNRLRPEQATQLRLALAPFEEDMGDAISDLFYYIDRKTEVSNTWTFVMLSPQQNQAVVKYLLTHSSRPQQAVHLWALCFSHLNTVTNEIMLTREEIARELEIPVNSVTKIMGELKARNAITSRRVPIKGMRGAGAVRYSLNPNVATHMGGAVRELAQATAPAVLHDEPVRQRKERAQGTLHLVPPPQREKSADMRTKSPIP